MDTTRKYYLDLCNRIDEIISENNPCEFDSKGACLAHRTGKIEHMNCCRYCKRLGPKGCTEKILGCKLIFCGVALRNMDVGTRAEIDHIREKALIRGFTLVHAEIEYKFEPDALTKK